MNRIYRSIWNDRTGTYVAASENAKSNGRTASPGSAAVAAGARFVRKGLAVSVSLALAFSSNAYAGPTGGVVSAGSATITGGAGSTTINQASQNVAINWQGFGIGQGEAVRFVQPNSASVALNRVLGTDPSNILGSLSANGKVFLVNPNGILFGQGAQVNVGGLVASTLNIGDGDFMAGRYNFAGAGKGTILNQGLINTDGGYVALLGANVSNQGVISARLGTVVLAAGNAITLDVAGDGLLNVTLNQGVANALAQNGGLIQADGGQVLLTAQAAATLLQSAVINTGVIQAHTIDTRNGSIRLLGDMHSGMANVGGTLDASGTGAGQTGGSVTATAQHVGLFGAHINASGDAGGGTVLIGGGYQGKNAAVQNASAAYMSEDSTIGADAITQGNGGTVVLWSADSTRAYGSISARGGAQSGAGGLIETSGHWLDVDGITINAGAPNGARGTWLLDPADVTIGTGTTGATLTANVYSPNSGVGSATVDAAALRAALEAGGGTDVSITTTNTGAAGVPASGLGNITVASALTWTPTTASTLTLNAAGDVNINSAVTATKGNFVVCCGRDVNVNAAISTTNGSVLLAAGRDVNVLRTALNNASAITTTDGNIEICAGNNINLNNSFNPGTTLMTLTRGSVTAGESLSNLGVPRGLTLIAGNNGTGPGTAGGTVVFTNGGLAGTFITTTGPDPVTPTNIYYNPSSYTTPTDYSTFFTGNGGPLTQYMLVFPDGASRVENGTTTATFTGLKGSPAGVTLNTAGGNANFDTAAAGTNKTVTYTGFTLTQAPIATGGTATNYALPVTCCAPIVGKTTATITASTIAPTTTTTAATTTTTAATTTTTAATTTTTAATTTTTAATTTTTAATTTTTAATTTTTAAATTTTLAPTTTTTAAPTTTTTVATTTTTTLAPTTTTTAAPTTTTTVATTTTTTLPPIVPPIVPPLVPPTTLQYQPGLPVSVLGTGILMPPVVVVAPPAPPPPVIVPPPLVVPPEAPPVYVPPERPRKPERN